MQKLRAAATALPAGEPLTWARAGAENTDELADWTITLGSSAMYKVHTAVVASGARCSEKLRAQVIEAAKGEGARSTDLLSLIKSEAARAAIQKDPHSAPTVEFMLSWMYGHASDFSLPLLGGTPIAAPVAVTMAKGVASEQPDGDGAGDSVYEIFSTAIFGTPSKAAPTTASASPSATALSAASKAAAAHPLPAGTTDKVLALKPEQLPLMWQLADSLGVRGLKAKLAPVFDQHALPSSFVMEAAAFERLKLLVRALELHVEDIIGALCEQVRVRTSRRRGGCM